MPSSAGLYLCIEGRRGDGVIQIMERVHHGLLKGTMSKREASSPEYYYTHLDDELPDVKEEVSDAIIMLVLVKDEEFEV
jgi:hypothetical protein